MKKKYFLLLFIAVSVWCCKKDKTVSDTPDNPAAPVDSAILTSVKIEAKNNPGKITTDIACTISATDEITAVIPGLNAGKKLVLSFTTKNTGTTVKVKDTLQVSGVTTTDFTKVVSYAVQSASGLTKTYTVKIKVFTGLPILYINTTGSAPIVSKDVYVKGSMTVNPNLEYPQDVTTIPLQIKGHGNSTWTRSDFVKKPYRLKFDSKASMLGMLAGKGWVLLANYDDKTLMRNRIAMLLARRLGSNYALDSRFVEVVLNGEFLGNYLLTPQVDISANSVNDLDELSDKNTSDDEVTGGYLLERDSKKDADDYFVTTKGAPMCLKSPDPITPKQLAYIHNYIQTFEDVLFSPTWGDPVNGYAKYIDVDSFMNWYFTNEIVQNNDARDFSSIFYYKPRNGKLGMGPVWDFDLSAGNIDYTDGKNPTGIWFIRDSQWMIRLAQDPTFILKVRKRWADIKNKEVKQIFTDIDQTAAYLKLSQQQNFAKWPILDKYVWPNNVVLGTYDKEVAYMKDFIQQRVNWIDANMESW